MAACAITSVTFDAIPRSVTTNGYVRFFPTTAPSVPVKEYHWTFTDGTPGTSTEATPIVQYTSTGSKTVALYVVDMAGVSSSTTTTTNFIVVDDAANISNPPYDGSFEAASVFIYDDTNSMMVNRAPWSSGGAVKCSLFFSNPKVTTPVDKIGTLTFTLTDTGDSTATEKSLVAEGKSVVFIQGKTITFSGIIRRAVQSTQTGNVESTQMKQWTVECDSDLARLRKLKIKSTSLISGGKPMIDSPGNIVRAILDPESGEYDTRGVINTTDTSISYQLNSATQAEDPGSRYSHLMTLQNSTNYDLRSRPDYLVYPYTSFNGTTTITNSGAAWTNDEFIATPMYAFFVGRGPATSYEFTAVTSPYITVTGANTKFAINDKVRISTTGTLPTGLSVNTDYYLTSVGVNNMQMSTTLGGSSVTYTPGGSGTHSIVLVPKAGCTTYGKITDNTGTTVVCADMVGSEVAARGNGYFIIFRGYKVDFAPDLSQPFAVCNLDVNSSCFEFNDNDDKRKLATKIIASGKDRFGKTISVGVAAVHVYDNDRQFFADSTTVSKKSEGYVYKNGYYTGGVAYGSPLATTEVWLYGYEFVIPSGFITLVKLDGTSDSVVVSTTSEEVDQNGVRYTKVSMNPAYPITADYSNGGYLISSTIYIKEGIFSDGDDVLVGEEPITIVNVGSDTTYGNYFTCNPSLRIMSGSLKAYPHGVGSLVANNNTYSETSPETDSPVDLYGLIIDPRTVDGNITYADLDAYATTLLLGLGNFYKMATTWAPQRKCFVKKPGEYYKGSQASLSVPVTCGDRISITEYSGATPVEYQVVSSTTICNEGRQTLELGDFEKNVFTTLEQKTNAIDRTIT